MVLKKILEKLKRKKPGETGHGRFYRIELKSSKDFSIIRNHDVGKKGGLERVAGKRKDGDWETIGWLIEKRDAFVRGGELFGKSKYAKELIADFKERPVLLKGDIFRAKEK